MLHLAVAKSIWKFSTEGENKKMNILLIADADTRYGAPHSLLHMVQGLKELYEIDIKVVLPADSEMRTKLENMECDVFCIHYAPFYQGIPTDKWKYPIKYIIKGIPYWYGRIRAVKEVEQSIDLNKIDLIHSNSSREDLGAFIANRYNIPLIWHIREFGDRDYKCYSYRKNYIDFMNKNTSRFIAVSDAVKEHWVKKGIVREKIDRVYNGVLQQSILPKADYDVAQERKMLRTVMAGNVSITKGQIWAIEAIKRLYDEGIQVTLDVFGDGARSYEKKLRRKIHEYGIEHLVKFRGYQKDVSGCLSQYDVGLMCSRDEGFGRVTVEYMMAGLCVIASNTGANPELIENDESGLLYQYGDTFSLANAIKRCVEDSEFRRKLSEHGRLRANTEFTAIRNAMQVYDVYNRVLNENLNHLTVPGKME